jgi:Fe2+ transport system protein B
MARSLDELTKLFEEKGIADVVPDVAALIEAEKNRGIAAKREANREAEGLRKRAKAFEATARAAGIEDFEDLEGVTMSLSERLKAAEDGAKAKGKLSESEKQLAAILKKLEVIEKEKETLTKKSKDATIRAKLTDALKDKVLGLPLAVQALISSGEVDADGDNVIFKSGDETFDLNEGVNRFLSNNPELVKTKQSGGGGSSAAGTNKTKTLDRASYMSLQPRDQIAFTKGGGQVTD